MQIARDRAARAESFIRARGFEPRMFITERPRHAKEIADAMVSDGVSKIVAWGGDGTVNEVASALAFRNAALAIVPGGSGNGLARELRIPFAVESALDVALGGDECRVDAGELDGRLFFNVAGIGLDARVAHRFAAEGLLHRGFARYLTITARELFTYEPDYHTVVADGTAVRVRALLIAIANARQYGNGAVIAPAARVDDGRLDVVVVSARPPLVALLQVPRLFAGQIARVRGVATTTAVQIEITSARPVLYHVDGEPFVGAAAIRARVRPGALRVTVPPGHRLAGAASVQV